MPLVAHIRPTSGSPTFCHQWQKVGLPDVGLSQGREKLNDRVLRAVKAVVFLGI